MKTTLKVFNYRDSNHSYVTIERRLLKELGLLNQISIKSRQSKTGMTVYLHQDFDLEVLVEALERLDIELKLIDRFEDYCFVRNLSLFNPEL